MLLLENLTAPQFRDPVAAREYLEQIRWPEGPICPHCGSKGHAYRLEGNGGPKRTRARAGLLKCGDCRKQFSVTVGTVFERSKVPLNKWLLAAYLVCSSKKGMSSHLLHRTLGLTYKTAWFMAHRIRDAMNSDGPVPRPKLTGTVEVDETWIGGTPRHRGTRKEGAKAKKRKTIVMALVQRDGEVRTFKRLTGKTAKREIMRHVGDTVRIYTDEPGIYDAIPAPWATSHEKSITRALSTPALPSPQTCGRISRFSRGVCTGRSIS